MYNLFENLLWHMKLNILYLIKYIYLHELLDHAWAIQCAIIFHFCKIVVFRSPSRYFLLFPRTVHEDIELLQSKNMSERELQKEKKKEKKRRKKKRNKKDDVRTKVRGRENVSLYLSNAYTNREIIIIIIIIYCCVLRG